MENKKIIYCQGLRMGGEQGTDGCGFNRQPNTSCVETIQYLLDCSAVYVHEPEQGIKLCRT